MAQFRAHLFVNWFNRDNGERCNIVDNIAPPLNSPPQKTALKLGQFKTLISFSPLSTFLQDIYSFNKPQNWSFPSRRELAPLSIKAIRFTADRIPF